MRKHRVTDHSPSYAEPKEMKMVILYTHGWLRAILRDCYSSYNFVWYIGHFVEIFVWWNWGVEEYLWAGVACVGKCIFDKQ